MILTTSLLILALVQLGDAFTPNVTVDCDLGPTYTVTLSDGSTTGVIFIDGKCATQATAETGTYVFDNAACTVDGGTAPALGDSFKLVVQEYSTINLQSDYIVMVTCTLETGTLNQTVTVTASGETQDDDSSVKLSPTFTTDFNDDAGTAIAAGAIGDPVQVVLSIPTEEAAVFDYQVSGLTVANGADAVVLITSGCPDFPSIFSQPAAQSGGELIMSFNLFIPKDTGASPTLPGDSGTALTFTFVINVCDGTCAPITCSRRKKRDIDNTTTTDNVEVATSFLVYPEGHPALKNRYVEKKATSESDVCVSKTPLMAVLLAMSAALLVCACITACVVVRLRTSRGKQYGGTSGGTSNVGYKY